MRIPTPLLCFTFVWLTPLFAQERPRTEAERLQAYQQFLGMGTLVEGGTVVPNWMPDGHSFWYADGPADETVIYRIDAKANTQAPFFDTKRLRKSLATALGHAPPRKGLPFRSFEFAGGQSKVVFEVEQREFVLDLRTYLVHERPRPSEEAKKRTTPQKLRDAFSAGSPDEYEIPSPNKKWFLGSDDGVLWLRSAIDGRKVQLTEGGQEDYGWESEGSRWSPDGYKIATSRFDAREVEKVPVVHWLKTVEEVEFFPFPKAGGTIPHTALQILDIRNKQAVSVEDGDWKDHYYFPYGWLQDGSEMIYMRVDRRCQNLAMLAADRETGRSRVLVEETSDTFIEGLHLFVIKDQMLTPLGDGEHFIWMSQRSGWNHLYLYHLEDGYQHSLTSGEWPVIRVETIDLENEWIYFTAHAEERPYDTQLYRVDIRGQNRQRLTEAYGQRSLSFSPTKEYFVETHSTVARPPTTELRRANGELVRVISEADVGKLRALGWSGAEEFRVKAADGETDLYGALFKPTDFDPERKYPTLDYIYNGPFTTWVPRTFLDFRASYAQALAELGFLVMIVDGRGTIERGKAFQDVVYLNWGRHEVPDHAAALKQLAAERPYIDTERVGIFGGSWGGYMTIRALTTHPEVYHAGVATNPVADLYDHAAIPIEPYMGLPQENPQAYEYASSIRLADRVKGQLMLIHGTSDVNATFSASMKMVAALVKAGIQHEVVVLPGASHSPQGMDLAYYLAAQKRHFVRHLHPEKIVPTVSESGAKPR